MRLHWYGELSLEQTVNPRTTSSIPGVTEITWAPVNNQVALRFAFLVAYPEA
jgi:hypothetical protein